MKKLLLALLFISTAAFSQKILVRDGTKLVPIILTAQEGDTLVMSSMMPEFFSRFSQVDTTYNLIRNDISGWGYATLGLKSMAIVDSTRYLRNTSTNASSYGIGNRTSTTMQSAAINDIGIGDSTLLNITTGSNNIVIGTGAGKLFDAVNHTIAIGYGALGSRSGANGYNMAIGSYALWLLPSAFSAGSNTAIGYQSMKNRTSGANNTSLGNQAMIGLVGYSTGSNNTAIGASALNGITSGGYNTAVGQSALGAVRGGSHNTSVGTQALASVDSSITGSTAIGDYAGFNNHASYSTYVGTSAGYNSGGYANKGGRRIALGYYAGYNATNTNALNIDVYQRPTLASDTTNAIIYGQMDSISTNQKLYLNANVIVKHVATFPNMPSDSTGLPTGALWFKPADGTVHRKY